MAELQDHPSLVHWNVLFHDTPNDWPASSHEWRSISIRVGEIEEGHVV